MPPRGGHSLDVVGDYVVTFGGKGQAGEPLLDCWVARASSKHL